MARSAMRPAQELSMYVVFTALFTAMVFTSGPDEQMFWLVRTFRYSTIAPVDHYGGAAR